MKTPDEIKKSLECMKKAFDEKCDFKCDRCPVYVPGYKNTSMSVDALAYIQQLEAELADAKRNHQHTIDIAEKQKEQIGKLKKLVVRLSKEIATISAERDAAVDCLRGDCRQCIHFRLTVVEEPCKSCIRSAYDAREKWQWRGVCPENTEVQEGG